MKKVGWREGWEQLRKRLEEWAQTIDSLLRPEPELTPVPVRVRTPGQPRR